ncbi:MAG: hypothetical protein JNM07_11090 [Phycisphaerae bacterium]|nr:hypothetical protein [Phycisphaerae bacterium]
MRIAFAASVALSVPALLSAQTSTGSGSGAGAGGNGAGIRYTSSPFVNWESPHVHPMDMTPDGGRLLVVNTADNRLEIFDLTINGPVKAGSIPVGLDPVSVRARTSTEAWVVNHVSDSVSIVNLTTQSVARTLKAKDEPCDVVFAAGGTRAFVTVSQPDAVLVFTVADLSLPPTMVPITGVEPRSLAVSPDGSRVYAAIFASGNGSTVLGGGGLNSGGASLGFPPNVVSNVAGPYGGVNPPPNNGAFFDPPIDPANNPPIKASLIVKKNPAGQWMDDNNGDWTAFVSGAQAASSGRPVGWDLADHDIAAIDANTLSVTYARSLMNICMSVGVNPATGAIALVGTDATNEIRFEPVLKGTFVRVNLALVDPSNFANRSVVDLNPHLTYETSSVNQKERDKSIGDPRAIVWNAAGTRAYVAGLGSNNLVVIDASGARAGLAETIPVREGPTGLALDEARGWLYVLNRFDGSISLVDVSSEVESARVPFFDPTPLTVKTGRKHLYDTHKNSGLGQLACASCHVDARMDRLAWDLGDPAGAIAPLTNRNLGQGLPGLAPGAPTPVPFQPFHPMKGPMTTQSLQAIIGLEPHHWRGDRLGIEEFNGAFIGLQGDDGNLTPGEMQEFEDFLASVTYPPNPFRNFDNTLPTSLPLPGHFTTGRFAPAGQPLPNGNAQSGLTIYRSTTRLLDMGGFACVTCHTLPTGAGTDYAWSLSQNRYLPINPGPLGERHLSVVSVDGTTNITTKIPQLRNEYKKVGFNTTRPLNTLGFGVLHDGSVDSLERFVSEPVFTVQSDQEIANLTALLLAFSGSDLPAGSATNPREPPGPPSADTHAAVGVQVTIASPTPPAADQTTINSMITQANTGKIALVAKGRAAGQARSYAYQGGGNWKPDRIAESLLTSAQLQSLAGVGSELTYTVVPAGSQNRIGLDRDSDGWYDRDELSVCADPADPSIFPGGQGSIDVNGDLRVDDFDFFDFLNAFSTSGQLGDFNRDGSVNSADYLDFLNAFFAGC